MKRNWKAWIIKALFLAGGALTGLVYYQFVRCADGTCPLTSSPWITMAYMGVVGWLLSDVLKPVFDRVKHR